LSLAGPEYHVLPGERSDGIDALRAVRVTDTCHALSQLDKECGLLLGQDIPYIDGSRDGADQEYGVVVVVEVKVADLVRDVSLMKDLGACWALRFEDFNMSNEVPHRIEVFVFRK